jgi:hypothetical protein
MPVLVLAARLCPEGVEATLFATLMSILNGGAFVGSFLGGRAASPYQHGASRARGRQGAGMPAVLQGSWGHSLALYPGSAKIVRASLAGIPRSGARRNNPRRRAVEPLACLHAPTPAAPSPAPAFTPL